MKTTEESGYSTPFSEIQNRIERFQESLRFSEIDAALLVQNADLFYFSGTIQRSHLYVPAEGEPLLMVRKNMKRAIVESPLRHLVHVASPKELLETIEDHGCERPKRIGMELDVLPANLFFYYQQIFRSISIVDVSSQIRGIRSVKSSYEIDLIRIASKKADDLALYVSEVLKPGMREVELAGLVEGQARRRGHHGLTRMRSFNAELYYGHLASGPNGALASFLDSPTGGMGMSPALAQSAGSRRIHANEPVVVDYVFGCDGYLADHARVYSLGQLDQSLKQAHEIMLEVQAMLIKEASAGQTCELLFEKALKIVAMNGLKDHFMGYGEQAVSFVGHGVGLEVDELPVIGKRQRRVLEQDMIVALEPKVIFPGKGVVGIENMFRVTATGLERLTHAEDKIHVIE